MLLRRITEPLDHLQELLQSLHAVFARRLIEQDKHLHDLEDQLVQLIHLLFSPAPFYLRQLSLVEMKYFHELSETKVN